MTTNMVRRHGSKKSMWNHININIAVVTISITRKNISDLPMTTMLVLKKMRTRSGSQTRKNTRNNVLYLRKINARARAKKKARM